MTNTRLDAALRYAAAGIPIFPCVPDDKRPLTEHGFLDASTDHEQLTAWFTRWPNANLAMPTGAPGYDVLDVDVRASGAGWPAYNRANGEGMTAGWTHAVRTPSGGLHLYYPGSEQRNATLPAHHLDFRGVGGYVIVPPSRVRTDTYAGDYALIAKGEHVARPLDWTRIRELVAPDAVQRRSPPRRERQAPHGEVVEWLSRWISQQPQGNRNQALFWAACRAAEHGVTDPGSLVNAATSIGLSAREAAATVASAYRRASTASRLTTGAAQDALERDSALAR